jgi:anti-anti-sigma regulatory factor
MIDLPDGWRLGIDRSPEWIFCRLIAPSHGAPGEPPLAEQVALAAAEHGVSRIVLELDESVVLYSFLVGQLIALQKRYVASGGAFRLCGLNANNLKVLQTLHLTDRLPNYRDRESAVLGRLG